jgi:hypothetical protein
MAGAKEGKGGRRGRELGPLEKGYFGSVRRYPSSGWRCLTPRGKKMSRKEGRGSTEERGEEAKTLGNAVTGTPLTPSDL